MRVSTWWRAASLAAAVFVVGAAAAQGWDHGGPGRHGPDFLAHMAKHLDLTEEQSATIQKIVNTYMDGALGDKMEAMHQAREALGAAIHDPAKSDRQVQDTASAVTLLEEQIAVERHHMANEIQDVLTPEQRQKAAQLAQEHRGFRRGPPPPDGPDGF
jgi:Spy/CpxP family protein refolding chaperone